MHCVGRYLWPATLEGQCYLFMYKRYSNFKLFVCCRAVVAWQLEVFACSRVLRASYDFARVVFFFFFFRSGLVLAF